MDYKKLKKGMILKLHDSKFKLLTKPKYVATSSQGGFYANIMWLPEKTILKSYQINKVGLEIVKKKQ